MKARKQRSKHQRWDQMDKSQLSLRALAEQYLVTCQTEGKSPKTLRGYKEKLSRFVRWLEGPLAGFTLEAVRRYVIHLQAAQKWDGHPFTPKTGDRLSPTSVRNHVVAIKAFATWLWEEGYAPDNVLERLSRPTAPRKLIEPLTREECSKLLESIDLNAANGTRDIAIVALLLDTGLRCGELVSLRVLDVHLQDQWLKVMGKGQKERMVPFGARAGNILQRYLTFFRPKTYPHPEFFLTVDGDPITENTVTMLFARLRKKTGIERLHPHLLRHTFATSYLVAGGDVFTLQHILGHTTLEMTRRYVSLASSQVSIQQHRFSPIDGMKTPALRMRGKANAKRERNSPKVKVSFLRLPLDSQYSGRW